MKLRHPLLFAFVLLGAPIVLQAQTVIASSYNGTTPGLLFTDVLRASAPLGTYTGLSAGESFTTGAQSYTFSSVVANLRLLVGSSTNLAAGIYSNSGGTPGSLLATLTVPSMTLNSRSNFSFTASTSLTLAASTTYWFVVGPSTSTTSLVDATWYTGTSGTGLATAALNSNGLSLGSWVPDLGSASLSYQINGSAIPEPSTYAMATGAMALGFVVWRRRRTMSAT
jgi:hypothetical protein